MAAEYDLRLDVPIRAFINASLQLLLEKGGTFWDAKKQLFSQEVYRKQDMEQQVYGYSLCDHSWAIGLLYCTIVVPKEFLRLPPNHRIYREFDARVATRRFTVVEPSKMDSYQFLHCLRNSVAHALFSVTESNGEPHYTFWTDREPIFRATIGHKGLIEFINAVGRPLIDAVLEGKKGMKGEAAPREE